ncbi:proteasome assembly chaperone 2 [Kwoniella heveanensis CBS 569]|nr:proteasome assembly chaperone 2 [Kwoniella heveanensis CBS 569]
MTDFHAVPGFTASSFNNSTLIVPAVSLGNVPQLTSDLLIKSLGLKRVGYVGDGSTVAPFAGRGEDGEVVTGGLEVYGHEGGELFVIQQRSPTLKTSKDEHVALLSGFIRSAEYAFSSVLILTSLDAASQDDAQLLTPHQRIIPPARSNSSAGFSSPIPILQRLEQNLPPLRLNIEPSRFGSSGQPGQSPSTSTPGALYPPFLPAAGLTRRLLASLDSTEMGQLQAPPHGAVTAWCVEGDNRGDAISLTQLVLSLLGIENDVQLKEPTSWQGLFGTTQGWSGGMGQDSELYG